MSLYNTLQRQPSKSISSWLYYLKRLFWASMLLMHAAPIHALSLQAIHSTTSPAFMQTLWSLLGLGLSAIFFVLKVADVSWLRRNSGWRSAVASTMVVALIHVGVLAHSSSTNRFSQITPVGVVVLAAIMTDGPRSLRRSARMLWPRLLRHCGELFSLNLLRAWLGWINHHFSQCQRWFRTYLAARAPPALMPS